MEKILDYVRCESNCQDHDRERETTVHIGPDQHDGCDATDQHYGLVLPAGQDEHQDGCEQDGSGVGP